MNKYVLWLGVGVLVVVIGGLLFLGLFVATKQKTKTESVTPVTSTDTKKEAVSPELTWTATGVAVPGKFADADTVKLAENSYRMYYSIQPEVKGNNFEVYSATSTDGKTWTQEAGTRKTMATFPDVVKLSDGRFRMYFQNAGVIKSAISTDGLKFTDETGTRIDKINAFGFTFDNVAAPTVLSAKEGDIMVYRGTINVPYSGEPVPNKNTQLLLWATSTDGLNWSKEGGWLAIDSRNTTLYGLADGPELFYADDGSMKLSFWSYLGVYWSDLTSDGGFSAPKKVFALAESSPQNKFHAATPGDPVYAQFNSVWYMYYGRPDGINYAIAK